MNESGHSFAQWLRHRRHALHLTQQQLGQLAHCSEAMIRKIEADARLPSREVAALLAIALQIPERDHAAFLAFARGQFLHDPLPFPASAAPPEHPLYAPMNVPVPPNELIGRLEEVTRLSDLIKQPRVRLVTLTGPGGVGKTRLGVAIATALRDAFLSGIVFVSLAPLSDPAQVLPTIAQVLEVREMGGQTLLQRVQAYLRDRHLLLVLDNFEQVVAASSMVAELIQNTLHLKVLVTSRAPLRVRAEHEFEVTPLELPAVGIHDVATLAQFDVVRLFIERARAVHTNFAVTNTVIPIIAAICVRLDGLPLAIELAAARIKILSPEALLQRLSHRLKLLTTGARDLPTRQQTLRATIEWSYNLLVQDEQRLFARLAVFVGGWTLESAEQVCSADVDRHIDVLDGLMALTNMSLIQQQLVGDGQRFVMLETIREYALERLTGSGEAEIVGRRHTTYFRGLIEAAERPQGEGWSERFDVERHNLRAVLHRALEHEDAYLVLKLSAELQWFWIHLGLVSEGRKWVSDGLQIGDAVERGTRAKALGCAGAMAWRQGDYADAVYPLESALELFREAGDAESSAWMLCNLGKTVLELGDAVRAASLVTEGLALFRELGYARGVAWASVTLGEVAFVQGTYAQATNLLEEALALFDQCSELNGAAVVHTHLAETAFAQGYYDQTYTLLAKSLTLFMDLKFIIDIPFILAYMAGIASAQQNAPRAARLWGSAEMLRGTLGILVPPRRIDRYEAIIASIRSQLDPTTFAENYAKGQATSLEQAVAYALEPLPDFPG